MQKISIRAPLAIILSITQIVSTAAVRAEEPKQSTLPVASIYQSALDMGQTLHTDALPRQNEQEPQNPQGQDPNSTPPIPTPQAATTNGAQAPAQGAGAPPGATQIRVAVLEKKKNGHYRFKRNLEQNIKIYEDGVQQDAKVELLDDQPVTVAFLFEWRSILPLSIARADYQVYNSYYFLFRSILNDVVGFIQQLREDEDPGDNKPKDTFAVVSYNDWKKPDCEHLCSKIKNADKKEDCQENKIPLCQKDSEAHFNHKWITDFTNDPNKAVGGLNQLAMEYFPYSSESDLNDTLGEVIDRLQDYKGLKTIVIVGTGIDTFSSNYRNPKEMLQKAAKSNVQIFTVGTGQVLNAWMEWACTRIYRQECPMVQSVSDFVFNIPRNSEFILGDNYLGEISKASGGRHYQPRDLDDEMADTFDKLFTLARNEYLVTYVPKNKAEPNKLEVKLLDENGQEMLDKKGISKTPLLKGKDGKPAKIMIDHPGSRPAM